MVDQEMLLQKKKYMDSALFYSLRSNRCVRVSNHTVEQRKESTKLSLVSWFSKKPATTIFLRTRRKKITRVVLMAR
jgi:hypothetical protein